MAMPHAALRSLKTFVMPCFVGKGLTVKADVKYVKSYMTVQLTCCAGGSRAHLINELATVLVVLLQHLVPQVTVHTLHNVPGLNLEQAARQPRA